MDAPNVIKKAITRALTPDGYEDRRLLLQAAGVIPLHSWRGLKTSLAGHCTRGALGKNHVRSEMSYVRKGRPSVCSQSRE